MSSSSAGIEMGWWSNNSGGSSGSSSPSTSGWWAGSSSSPAAPAPSHHGGGLLGGIEHFAQHLGSDAKDAITGLGTGAAQLATTIYKGDVGVLTGNQKAQQQASDTAGQVV